MRCGPFLVKNTAGEGKGGILISDVTVGIAPDTGATYANVTKQSHVCVHILAITSIAKLITAGILLHAISVESMQTL